jgi:hypothetical protein
MFVPAADRRPVVHRPGTGYSDGRRGYGPSFCYGRYMFASVGNVATLMAMRLLIIYRPNSEHARAVETFIHDFQRLHEGPGRRMEVMSTETRDGAATMSLYDIFESPVIMVLGDDGQMTTHWSGEQLPLMDEVASYFHNAQTR